MAKCCEQQDARRSQIQIAVIPLIIICGIYPIAVLGYYLASGKLGDVHPPPSDVPSFIDPTSKNISTPIIASSETNHKNTDVIVYLAQFGNHSSYGAQYDAKRKAITGLSKLNQSLELLYTNYVYQFPTDVIIFYDHLSNAPDAATIEALQRNRPQLQFRSLDEKWWSLPHGLQSWQHMFWNRPAFSIGYRLMMRWYAILIWFYLDAEGYTHCMRLDDDSYILSKIEYNLFDYMRVNKKRYAFRQPVYEGTGDEFDKLIDKHLMDPRNGTSATQELTDLYKQDRGVSFYNNFFMAEVSFFMTPPASTLLRIIDESKLIFTQRTGDLVI
ncbi:hypothetical protein ACHAXR_001909, partial [Thalassiosira sp. AJA248-18]